MIIEIKDLPPGQKIQRISVNVEFCDSSIACDSSITCDSSGTSEILEQTAFREVPGNQDKPTAPVKNKKEPKTEEQETKKPDIPAEMLDLEL